MIEKSELMPLNYYKKSVFTGGYRGMRYRIEKAEEEFLVTIWPEPYNFETTKEEKKQSCRFAFSEEGKEALTEWLNQQYCDRQKEWEAVLSNGSRG